MSTPLLLRAFVNERLAAAVDEIFQVFESTIAKYEAEASSSKQEIERLRGLLRQFVAEHKTADSCQSSICKEETPPQQHHRDLELDEPDCRHIKKEETAECKDAEAFHPASSRMYDNEEQSDAKDALLLQAENSNMQEQVQESQKTKTLQFVLSVTSSLSSQTHIQSESVQDGSESERPAEHFTSHEKRAQQQQQQQQHGSLFVSGELADLHHCRLRDKSLSSDRHVTKHPDFLCESDCRDAPLKSHATSRCCHVCGKLYKSSALLTDHISSHTGAKPHRCHVCGTRCRRKGDLKIHMRIHTGEKPFRCSYCGQSFTSSGHLKKHVRSHTGERPHRCGVCGRGFLQSSHLKYHLGTHG